LLVATLAAIGDGRIDLNSAGQGDALDLSAEIEPGLTPK